MHRRGRSSSSNPKFSDHVDGELEPVMKENDNLARPPPGVPFSGKVYHKHDTNWYIVIIAGTVFLFFFHTHILSSFRTSRGHRCRPFSPPVLAFNFYRA